ncbi:class I adenylate-forming enzyme family protein [Nevskia soli]|uniref:class I adenylate-forming enzyme family protein n=1 Tax=Nevskia soli TaxID=418856 RepID=UPI0004A6B516|nr:AMP-binding protein [Nevskia soli]
MNLARLLVRTAATFPERPALIHGQELLCDYRGLALRAARVGSFLRHDLSLAAGERICLWMSNTPEYLEILYGAWFAGLVVVPINLKLHPREVEYILQDSGAAALFVSADLVGQSKNWAGQPRLRGVFVPGTLDYARLYRAEPMAEPLFRAQDDIAWLFYTSGTTGRPKGVMQTHANLLTMISCYFMDLDTVSPDDGTVYAAPMSHAAGMLNFPHIIGAARHIIPRSGGFDPQELLELAEYHGRLTLFAAPTMVKRLVDYVEATGADPSGFRTIVYGGGPMYVEDMRRALRVMGERFVQIYGQGETPMTITALSRHHLGDSEHPRYLERIASVGVSQTLVEVRVADAQGCALLQGETGEVVVRGPSVMKGYWNNPEATAQAIRDGWLFTGDVGSFDEDGFLTLKDRSKDVIISGGSNIYPREVEEVLLQHPQVEEVSVVGQRHDEWGEEVVAFVVTKDGRPIDAGELDDLCLQTIARFKRPKQYRFVPALPKSSYGKVLKTALREQLAAG